jgi:hypothetical protein
MAHLVLLDKAGQTTAMRVNLVGITPSGMKEGDLNLNLRDEDSRLQRLCLNTAEAGLLRDLLAKHINQAESERAQADKVRRHQEGGAGHPEGCQCIYCDDQPGVLKADRRGPAPHMLEWQRPEIGADTDVKHWALVEGGRYVINPQGPRQWYVSFGTSFDAQPERIGLTPSLLEAKGLAQAHNRTRLSRSMPANVPFAGLKAAIMQALGVNMLQLRQIVKAVNMPISGKVLHLGPAPARLPLRKV